MHRQSDSLLPHARRHSAQRQCWGSEGAAAQPLSFGKTSRAKSSTPSASRKRRPNAARASADRLYKYSAFLPPSKPFWSPCPARCTTQPLRTIHDASSKTLLFNCALTNTAIRDSCVLISHAYTLSEVEVQFSRSALAIFACDSLTSSLNHTSHLSIYPSKGLLASLLVALLLFH